MSDSNKLVSLIVLVIVGLMVGIFGGIFIYLNRKDKATLALAIAEGRITAAEAAALTNQTWYLILAGVLIVLGLVLVFWGIFQYFAKAEDVYKIATSKAKEFMKKSQVVDREVQPMNLVRETRVSAMPSGDTTETISVAPLDMRAGRSPVTRRAPFSAF